MIVFVDEQYTSLMNSCCVLPFYENGNVDYIMLMNK